MPYRSPAAGGRSDGRCNTEAIGNDVLEKLLLEVGVPAVVYSGYTQEASELVRNSEIKVFQKAKGGAMEALHWLAGHDRLMSAMETTRKDIARESAMLFSKSIWPRWKNTLRIHRRSQSAGRCYFTSDGLSCRRAAGDASDLSSPGRVLFRAAPFRQAGYGGLAKDEQ